MARLRLQQMCRSGVSKQTSEKKRDNAEDGTVSQRLFNLMVFSGSEMDMKLWNISNTRSGSASIFQAVGVVLV